MANKLSDKTRNRLIALCGMLGSNFEGERSNAGKLADSLLRINKLTWADVITAGGGRPSAPERELNHQDMARECLDCDEHWTPWEEEFLNSMLKRYKLTEKQSAILDTLYERATEGYDF